VACAPPRRYPPLRPAFPPAHALNTRFQCCCSEA